MVVGLAGKWNSILEMKIMNCLLNTKVKVSTCAFVCLRERKKWVGDKCEAIDQDGLKGTSSLNFRQASSLILNFWPPFSHSIYLRKHITVNSC
jgi:hypothetical protein